MKQLLFTATLLLSSLFCFSQTYVLDSSHHYLYVNGNAENVENNYYEYDANGLRTFFYDNAGTAFGGSPNVAVNEETYTYNSADLLIYIEAKRFDSGVLSYTKERFRGYDNLNRVISDSVFITDANNTSTLESAINFIYDSNDRLIERFFLNSNGDIKSNYFYTGNSTLMDSSIERTKDQGVYTAISSKAFYTYNTQNEIESIEFISYDIATGQISDGRRDEFWYDANGNYIRKIIKNRVNNVWQNFYATNIGYTSNNKISKYVGYNFSGNTWILNDSTLNTYDSNENLIYEVRYKTPNNILDIHNDYYYSPLTTSTASVRQESNIKITPNPYQTFMPLNITGIENESRINLQVFDLQGKMVFNNRFTNGQNIVVDKELTSGIYIFKVSNKEGQTLKSQQVFVY